MVTSCIVSGGLMHWDAFKLSFLYALLLHLLKSLILLMDLKCFWKCLKGERVYSTLPPLDLFVSTFSPNNWSQVRDFGQSLATPKIEDMVSSILDEFFKLFGSLCNSVNPNKTTLIYLCFVSLVAPKRGGGWIRFFDTFSGFMKNFVLSFVVMLSDER